MDVDSKLTLMQGCFISLQKTVGKLVEIEEGMFLIQIVIFLSWDITYTAVNVQEYYRYSIHPIQKLLNTKIIKNLDFHPNEGK